MAFGVISAFAHQRVTINTEIALDINITGNPENAFIEGLLEGFWTNWRDPVLQVRGVATRLVSNVPFTVKALKGSEELSRIGLFSVVPAAPVITSPGRQKFIRGINNALVVRISNSPSKVRAVGPWFGMKADSHPDGVMISGIVPEVSHAVPIADQKIRVTAASGVLTDEVEIDFDLQDPLYAYIHQLDRIYVVPVHFDDGKKLTDDDIVRQFSVSSSLNIEDMVLEDDNLYLLHRTTSAPRVYLTARDTADGARAVLSRTWGVHYNRSGNEYNLASDASNFYVMSSKHTVAVANRSFVHQRNFSMSGLPSGTNSNGAVVDGNNLYYNVANTYIAVVNKNNTGSREFSFTFV